MTTRSKAFLCIGRAPYFDSLVLLRLPSFKQPIQFPGLRHSVLGGAIAIGLGFNGWVVVLSVGDDLVGRNDNSTVDMFRRRAKTVASIYRSADGTCLASVVGQIALDLITSDYREAILHVLGSI